MARLLFSKTGNAVWISHLDLMRLFQRAFKRSGLPLKHTQGFNPRPSVSIALPLSVGVQSECELLDFELEACDATNDEIMTRLNETLVSGIQVLQVYDNGRKLRDLALLSCQIELEYDRGVAEEAANQIQALFERNTIVVLKKTKNGNTEQDIVPLIKEISIAVLDARTVLLNAQICCQNPSLNPMQMVAAIENFAPEWRPDHAVCRRVQLYDADKKVFR